MAGSCKSFELLGLVRVELLGEALPAREPDGATRRVEQAVARRPGRGAGGDPALDDRHPARDRLLAAVFERQVYRLAFCFGTRMVCPSAVETSSNKSTIA